MAKTVFALIFTLIVSASIPSPVFAAVKPGSKPAPVTLGGVSLTPTIGGYFFAGSEQRDAIQSYGLKAGYDKIGKSIADSLGIEGTLNYFTTTSKTDASDATGYLFRLDAIYPVIMGVKWMPFLAVGAGGIVIDSVSRADKSPLFNYGAGLKYFLEDYLAVRVDARHLVVYNNVNTRNNFEVGIGMSYYFGKERKKKPVPPLDSDQDGVPDNLDKCPNSPKGVKVGKNGCPADSDRDGVSEDLDKCPDTPFGAPVTLIGCPEVSAGVVQPEAKAVAPTPAPAPAKVETPAKVEAPPVAPTPVPATPPAKIEVVPVPVEPEMPVRQAVAKKFIKKLTINFNVDSSYIKPKYQKLLREMANTLKSSAGATATIEGHADSTGKLSYNIKLSNQRAQSVRRSLIKLGVDPGRISTVGYGPSRPIAGNATIKGRRMNRQAVTLVTLIVSD